MFGLGRNTKGPLYGALIDIGSGTIGIAIVASDLSHKLPTIIYQDRITMRVGKSTQGDDGIRRVREVLLEASLILGNDGRKALKEIDPHGQIRELCIAVSSPWSYTIVQTVEYTDEETFKVTESILSDLVMDAETSILDLVRKEHGGGKDGFEIVERATVGITVNEYPIENPLKLEGNMLSLTHVAGLIPQKIMESVTEMQDKIFPDTRLHAHTSMLSMYSVLGDIFPRTHSFCIIDVTGEATEFGIVEDDTLIENSFIPHGTYGFIESITEKTKRPVADIETSLRSYGDKGATKDADVLSALETYTDHVTEGVTNILSRRTLPTQIVITAHDPFKEAFTEAIAKGVKKATGKKPDTVSVNHHLIEEICHGTGTDVYLALLARFFHKLHAKEADIAS